MMILVALFVMGFRVTVVVQDVQTMMASVSAGRPVAFAKQEGGVRVEAAAGELMEDGMADNAMTDGERIADDLNIMGPADVEVLSSNANPQSFTPSELELLQHLSESRNFIEAQAQELKTREAMLSAETLIDGKLSELQQLEQTLAALVAEADSQQQAKIG